jgi:hypothetical protein
LKLLSFIALFVKHFLKLFLFFLKEFKQMPKTKVIYSFNPQISIEQRTLIGYINTKSIFLDCIVFF